jgi:hypothetical protein
MRHVLLLFLVSVLGFSCTPKKEPQTPEEFIVEEPVYEASEEVIKQAFAYCKAENMNTDFFLLVDFSVKSRKKRFFKVDFSSDSITLSGLVTHGHCQEWSNLKTEFSNVSGSNCSSLGKYKVGFKYEGSFGTAYKLHGLEESNSKAFDRFIVLHAHPCVPDEEQSFPICRSEGCPTVSPVMLEALEPYLDESDKPVLLWMVNGVIE